MLFTIFTLLYHTYSSYHIVPPKSCQRSTAQRKIVWRLRFDIHYFTERAYSNTNLRRDHATFFTFAAIE